MKGTLKLKLLLFSFMLAIGVAFLSRLFAISGIIGWEETGIAAAVSLIVTHLITILFIQEKKGRIVIRRYILVTGLILAALLYNNRKHSLVCSFTARKASPDGLTVYNTTTNIVTGTKLREEIKMDATIQMNKDSKCGLFDYIATRNPYKIWTTASIRSSNNQLLFTYLALVIFLVALITHLLEEILLSDMLTKLGKKEAFKHHVFISYNHDDKNTAIEINRALLNKKIKTILDTKNMTGGDDIGTFIRESIQMSGITLLIVSEKSLLSGWVATETVNTFFLEMYENSKSFIACYLDNSFLDPEFPNKALKIINEKLDVINNYLEERNRLGSDSRDLNDQKTRLFLLKNNLDKIIQRLQNSMCIDVGNRKFDENFSAIVNAIESKLKT